MAWGTRTIMLVLAMSGLVMISDLELLEIILELSFVCKFSVLFCFIIQLVLEWDIDDTHDPCSLKVTSANWYRAFRLNIRATADNLVESDMTRTIRIDYTKMVEGSDLMTLKNSTEVTVCCNDGLYYLSSPV